MFPKAAIAIFILLPAGWAAAQSADPTAAEHKRELAYNLYAKQQYGEALKVIEKHFPDPNDELISTTRFQCLIGLGRFAEALEASQKSRRQYHSKRLKQYEQGKRYTSENSFFETTQFPMAEVDHIALPRTPKVPLAK